jgi:hypothetical protein
VELDKYQGEPFFLHDIVDSETGQSVQDCSRWVPLKPVTSEWYKDNNITLQRTAFPINLAWAWAWTPWKGQGSTNREACVMHLGRFEKVAGLANVT